MDPSIPTDTDIISNLPSELKRCLVGYLDGWDVTQLYATSKTWQDLMEDMLEREENPNFTGRRLPKVVFDEITINGSRGDSPYTLTCKVQMSHRDEESLKFLRNRLREVPDLSFYGGGRLVMGRREAMVYLDGGIVNAPCWLLPRNKSLAPISEARQNPGPPSHSQPRHRPRLVRNDKSDLVVTDSFLHRNRGFTDQGNYLRRRFRLVDCRRLEICNDGGVILVGQLGAALEGRLMGVKRLVLDRVCLDFYRKLFLSVFMDSHKDLECVSIRHPTTFGPPDIYIPTYIPADFYENSPATLHNSALTFLSSLKTGHGHGSLVLDYPHCPFMLERQAAARDVSALWVERVVNLALNLSPPLLFFNYHGGNASLIRQEAILGYLVLWLAADEVIGEGMRRDARRRLVELEAGTAGSFVLNLQEVFNAHYPATNQPFFPAADNFILNWPHQTTTLRLTMDTFHILPQDSGPPTLFPLDAPLPPVPPVEGGHRIQLPFTPRTTYPALGTAIHQRLLLPLNLTGDVHFSTSKVLDKKRSHRHHLVYANYVTRLRIRRPDGKELVLILSNYYPQ